MVRQQLLKDLKKVLADLGYPVIYPAKGGTDPVFREQSSRKTGSTDPVLSISKNCQFGDYCSNIALQLANQKSKNDNQSSLEIAKEIISRLRGLSYLSDLRVAGPGFINFFLKDQVLIDNLDKLNQPDKTDRQKILIEYGHANILKEAHLGHLRTYLLGESLSRIFEYLNCQVFRANYQGDIGLHVAKAVYGMKKLGLPDEKLALKEKAAYLGKAYALGSLSYEEDEKTRAEIDQINLDLYNQDSQFWGIYQLGRSWSLEYYEDIYQLLDINYDRLFFESEVYQKGKEIVLENLGEVFEKSEGAIIFPGEKYGLHNRVFINKNGAATYEAKEMALAEKEYEVFPYDYSIHVVASEQAGYFQVVIKALDQIYPRLQGKKHHLSYGMVSLKGGKMSSRLGQVVTINELVERFSEKVKEVIKESRGEADQQLIKQVALGAIKFAYLKYAPIPDMVLDLEKSVSLQGDSGPYLQYTFARTQSVLKKSAEEKSFNSKETQLEPEERAILRRLGYFQEIVKMAGEEYRPNLICEYLVELAKDFNLFYQKYRIIESDKACLRLKLTEKVGEILQTGLKLLGIEAPERM